VCGSSTNRVVYANRQHVRVGRSLRRDDQLKAIVVSALRRFQRLNERVRWAANLAELVENDDCRA
jgi:hypothetical protein